MSGDGFYDEDPVDSRDWPLPQPRADQLNELQFQATKPPDPKPGLWTRVWRKMVGEDHE